VAGLDGAVERISVHRGRGISFGTEARASALASITGTNHRPRSIFATLRKQVACQRFHK
jgi:hypothetical protein